MKNESTFMKDDPTKNEEHEKFFRTFGAEGTPPPEVCPPIKGPKEKYEMEITVHFYENLEPCEVAAPDCKPSLAALRLKKPPAGLPMEPPAELP